MSATGPAPGSSGRCGRSGSSPSTTRSASPKSSPGIDPTPVRRTRSRGRLAAVARRVAEMVAEPTTREPSYTTTAWPGAIPGGRVEQVDVDGVPRRRGRPPGARRRARAAARCTRVRPSGAAPHQRGLIAVSPSTAARSRADGDGARDRLDVEHVARLAVGRRRPDAQAPALADRVAPRPLVRAEHLAVGGDDRAPRLTSDELLGEPAAGVAVADEADVVAVGLVGDGQPATRRLLADRRTSGCRRAGTSSARAAPG